MKGIRKKLKLQILVISLVSVLYVAAGALIVLFINTAFHQVEAQRQHRIERALFAVVQYYMNGVEVRDAFDEVRSAYLIDENDTVVFTLAGDESGNPLDRIKTLMPAGADFYLEPNYDRNTVLVIRRMDQPTPPEEGHTGAEQTERDSDREPGPPRIFYFPRERDSLTVLERPFMKYVYAEVRASDYVLFRRFYYPIQIGALVLLLGFLGFVTYVFLRNIRYRNEMQMEKDFIVLGRAASTLAHEMKNPLSAIMIQTSLLKMKTQAGACAEEIRIIEEEAGRLKKLSSTVGQLIRNPLGDPEPVDIVRLIADIIRKKNPAVRLIREKPVPPVLFDPLRLAMVLENIINNALESLSPPEKIAVQVAAEKRRVTVIVSDRGTGFKEDPAVLFTPLFTTKPSGSGLGLSVARRYLDAAGASISIKNRHDGPGAVVEIRFAGKGVGKQ